MMCTKFPLVAVLMELAAQSRARHLCLRVAWAPRSQNSEADSLSNERCHEFDPAKRIVVTADFDQFVCLRKILDLGYDLFEDIKAARLEEKSKGGATITSGLAKRRKTVSFRQTDPW